MRRAAAWLLMFAACASHARVGHADEYTFDLPAGWPPPVVPAGNPMSGPKVRLGKRLFSDPRLSVTGAYSCASCHDPARHFTDGRPRALGATGELHAHNTPSLLNAAYGASFGWTDRGLTTLEDQHRVPLTNTAPVEMGFDETELQALRADPDLARAFDAAFGEGVISLDLLSRALASYVRSLIAADSAFDRYLMWDERDALDPGARRGMQLFFSEPLGCSTCHASFNLSGPVRHGDFPGRPGSAGDAPGVFHVNGVGGSQEAFRAPALRNVAHTAPYMHDGSMASLGEVLDFYARGGAERLPGFELSEPDRSALLAFLNAL